VAGQAGADGAIAQPAASVEAYIFPLLVAMSAGAQPLSDFLESSHQANFDERDSVRVLKDVRVEDRDAVSAESQAAGSRAELSAGVLARTEQLARSGAATPDELERARRQAQTDDATAEASEARLRAAEAGSRIEEVGFQRARVAAAEARVAQAKAQVGRLAVRAPLDGEVPVRPGELYSFQGSTPLAVLGDTRRLRVRMDVDERDVAKVKLGAKAWVMADAFGDRRFEGQVVEIGRRFGRKNVRTDDPIEKNDAKILETVVELTGAVPLVVGQRVTSFIALPEWQVALEGHAEHRAGAIAVEDRGDPGLQREPRRREKERGHQQRCASELQRGVGEKDHDAGGVGGAWLRHHERWPDEGHEERPKRVDPAQARPRGIDDLGDDAESNRGQVRRAERRGAADDQRLLHRRHRRRRATQATWVRVRRGWGREQRRDEEREDEAHSCRPRVAPTPPG
jgi:hypothetical protein